MSKQVVCSSRSRPWPLVPLLAAVSLQALSADKVSTYTFVKEIPIAGDTGWDYLSIDAEARRLYVTHGTHIVVVDLDTNAVVGDIGDTPGVHGFAIAHELGKGFSSNGAESKVGIVDLKSLATIAKVPTEEGPDGIVYEPERKEVYAFNGRAKSVTIIAAGSGNVVTSVKLPGKPEFPAADPGAHRVFVNIEDKSEIVAIDTGTHQIVSEWPIAPGESASGMALDAAHHRLFVGCDNHLMLMLNSETGKVMDSVAIGTGVDANAFDNARQLAFSSNGEGTVTVAREESPARLVVAQTLHTQASARTMALDPVTHRIYLAAATLQPPQKDTAESPHHRRTVPGTFKVLVYGPES
jgi:DNA-binding beta-propeller fold protein YncE